ncbi:hypothetical protein QR66_07715 [Chromobacterium piscinae]|nr:hypothetical protein QR66_07715 [Chromobacterium piscinae]
MGAARFHFQSRDFPASGLHIVAMDKAMAQIMRAQSRPGGVAIQPHIAQTLRRSHIKRMANHGRHHTLPGKVAAHGDAGQEHRLPRRRIWPKQGIVILNFDHAQPLAGPLDIMKPACCHVRRHPLDSHLRRQPHFAFARAQPRRGFGKSIGDALRLIRPGPQQTQAAACRAVADKLYVIDQAAAHGIAIRQHLATDKAGSLQHPHRGLVAPRHRRALLMHALP